MTTQLKDSSKTDNPGVAVPAWLVWGGFIALLATIGVVVFGAIRQDAKQQAAWKPLESPYAQDATYLVGADVEALKNALATAVGDLAGIPGWSTEEIAADLRGFGFRVMSTERWKNYAGQWVGSEVDVDLKVLRVNPSLSGLAHEIAHVVEAREYGAIDYGHAQWEARGIQAAVNRYQAKYVEVMP